MSMSPKGDQSLEAMADLRPSEERELMPKAAAAVTTTTTTNKESRSRVLPRLAALLAPFSPAARQTFASCGCLGLVVGSGMTSGFSAILLPQLKAATSSITIDDTQASWIASLAALPMCIGCLASGPFMERWGRRTTHQLLALPFTLGWLLIACATSVRMLYVGRVITGLCVGIGGPLPTVYMAEVSAPVYRGIFLASISFAVSTGILVTHLLGTFVSWPVNAIICSMFPLFCFATLACVPETPAWLAEHRGEAASRISFHFYRGNEAEDELSEMLAAARERRLQRERISPEKSLNESSWYRDRVFIKQLFIMIAFFFAQQFSGVNAIAFYTVTILQNLGTNVDEYFATNILDVVRALMSLVACYLLKRFSRRSLAVSSSLGTAVSLIALAGFLATQPATGFAWVPVACLISYVCWVSTGLVPLPWVMIGEVFPATSRGLGSGIASTLGFVCLFLVVKTSPGMFAGLGAAGTFALYGSVALCAALFLYLFLPETRNRTLADIEKSLKKESQQQPVNADPTRV